MQVTTSITKLSTAPEVKKIILAADPSYKRHSATLVQTDTVELYGTYWDGGTRYTYTAVNLVTKQASAAPQYAPTMYGGPQTTPKIDIPDGVAIVQTGVFCGKVAIARVYINPINATKFLPSP